MENFDVTKPDLEKLDEILYELRQEIPAPRWKHPSPLADLDDSFVQELINDFLIGETYCHTNLRYEIVSEIGKRWPLEETDEIVEILSLFNQEMEFVEIYRRAEERGYDVYNLLAFAMLIDDNCQTLENIVLKYGKKHLNDAQDSLLIGMIIFHSRGEIRELVDRIINEESFEVSYGAGSSQQLNTLLEELREGGQ